MKYYFFKTVIDKGRGRLRPLAGQTLPDGSKILQTLNVQSDKVIRASYPVGTVFGSSELYVRAGYYEAGQIFPLGVSSYEDPRHKPSSEMMGAFESFIVGGSASCDAFEAESEEPIEEKPTKKVDSLLNKMQKNSRFEVPTITKDGFYVDSDNWYLLLRNITNQVNTMLVGPTGTGKTELVMLACKKIGVPCHVYDMGSMHDPVAGMLGVHRLQKGGISTFDYAKFTKDIAQPGVVLLDELSRAPVTTNNILFPCLDSRRTLPVEMAGGDDVRSIKVHEDCCFIATANVGSEYTGTMSMDRALIGRFFPIELSYMPPNVEISVLTKRCGIPVSDAKHIVGTASQVRNLFTKQEIQATLSTRETLMAADLVADGWSPLRAMELVFLPLFEGTKSEGERGIIAKILLSR